MKTTAIAAAAFAAASLFGSLVLAADPPKPGPSCNTITYDAEFLKAYPRAPAACQEVVTSGGKKAARFTARVSNVKKDHIQLVFLNTMGDPIEPATQLTLLPQSGQTLRVNGKEVAYSTLSKGDKVDFWIPEKELGVISNPGATALSTIVIP